MAESQTTEDITNPLEKEAENDNNKKNQPEIDESKLSKNEVQRLKEEKTTIKEIVRQREQLKRAAEDELNHLTTVDENNESTIELAEYKKLKEELNKTESAEKMRDLLERIKKLPETKQRQKALEAQEAKELSPDDPKLIELQKKFNKICENNVHLIGTSQIEGFKKWAEQQIKENPTVKHLKDIIRKLEGKEVTDRDGLAPRREEYNYLQKLFQKYGFSSPLDSEYVKREGLSERKEFRKNAEELDQHFEKQRDTGFYSKEAITAVMRKMLKENSPGRQKEMVVQAKNIARQESETFVHMDDRVTISGVTIRKMSEASKRKYLEYYKDTNFNERVQLLPNLKKLIENEVDLAKQLEKIYGENKEGLKLALGSFEELDFLEKEKALKEHEKLVEAAKNKEELETELTIKAAHAKIDEAARKKIISSGGDSSTQAKYKKFFEDPNNFKNANTGKPGDVKQLKKAYETLTSSSPNTRYKNLAAYEARRKQYQKNVHDLVDLNPALTKEDIQKWHDKYDKEGWRTRTRIAEVELPKELEKERMKASKRRAEDKELGISDKEKNEAKERTPERTQLELFINDSLAENTKESISRGRKALRLYLIANPEEEDDQVMMYLEEQLVKAAREIGKEKKGEKTQEQTIEEEMGKVVATEQTEQAAIEEQQIKTLNLEGVRQSEERHQRIKSAQKRALKESMAKTKGGTLEADLTEDAYEQMGEEFRLNKEGSGEQIEEIDFKEAAQRSEERQSLKRKTYQEQTRLDKKEGFTHVTFKDKSGRKLSAQEAKAAQEKELEQLELELADKTLDKVKRKEGPKKPGTEAYDLTSKIAAHRKARELIDKKRHEKLRNAA